MREHSSEVSARFAYGAKFYPVQVEQTVRAFAELSDEFRIELETERETGLDRCTVVVEAGPGGEPKPPGDPVSYLARDYEGLLALMLDRLAATMPA